MAGCRNHWGQTENAQIKKKKKRKNQHTHAHTQKYSYLAIEENKKLNNTK